MPDFMQTLWKLWYQYVSGRIGNEGIHFLNYGYWPPEGATLNLKPEDESNRTAIQLYHHVASGWDLAGKKVLEVSCGHGGGASFIKRYHQPSAYTAIDQNPRAIDLNRKAHSSLDIDFRTGDAQALDFPPNHFDAVINIEASHCYPHQDSFFRSVHAVLRPGGHLLYADFRPHDRMEQLERDILEAGFQIKSRADITPHVVNALKLTSKRNRQLAHKLTPRILHPLMENFAAIEGTGVFNHFAKGELMYMSYQLVKPD